jgi:hypothetical protein
VATVKPFPVLVLRLEGGPDDGETRLMLAATSVVPREALEPSIDAAGAYVRPADMREPWTWRYVWYRSGRQSSG